MAELASLLRAHRAAYPEMEVQDAIKFLYQSHMGPGHLIADESAALARLQKEWDGVPSDPDAPLLTHLGNGLCRLHINACKGKGLSIHTLFRLFILTAQTAPLHQEALERDLELIRALPFPPQALAQLDSYRLQGCPPIGHSQAYRTAYAPTYRVVWERYANMVPLLCAIDALRSQEASVRVGIDGPCASGKSTLGAALAEIYRCPLLHMDDFFLRPEQRTQRRLAEPGGNVDYERFEQEVLEPLRQGRAARFCPWRCRAGDFGPAVTVPPSPLIVVEGSYALRPGLGEHYQLGVWVEAPWPVREARLLQRGGRACLERFLTQWIPLEERYFTAYQVKSRCQIVYSSISF